MSKTMGRMVLAGALALAGIAVGSQAVWADEGSAGSHGVTVRVTPTGTTAITISTHIVEMGTQGLGTNVVISTPVEITNSGTLGTDLQFTGTNMTGGNTWTLVETVGAMPADQVKLLGVLNATEPGSITDTAAFAIGTSANAAAGDHAGDQSADNLAVSGTVSLWFELYMPATSGSAAEHSGTVTITAASDTTF